MGNKLVGKGIKDYLGLITLFLFILSFTIAITIWFTPLYSMTARSLGVAEGLGMTHEQLIHNYDVLLDYLNYPWVNELVMPNFPSSESGLLHFYEVKILFMIDYVVLFLSAIGSAIYLRYIHQTKRYYTLVRPFKWAIFIPVILVVLLAINFDWMFLIFHQLLFNNDAWIFNPQTDPIILALPQQFFMYCFLFAFVLIELLIIGSYFYFKKNAISSD